MKITSGNEETQLSHAIRLCEMEVPLSRALNMNETPHGLIIGYLLKGECGELGVIVL